MVAADEPFPGKRAAGCGDAATLMRLVKYLAHAGVASRRAAEKLVAEGRVSLDGKTVTDPARDVGESARVSVDGRTTRTAVRRSSRSSPRRGGGSIPSGASTRTAAG
jgi:ribosomal 50S subunit-recycling heat shock protein